MKIPNHEMGNDVIYIQRKDLELMAKYNSLASEVCCSPIMQDKEDQFYRLENKDDVDTVKRDLSIVDYKKIRNLPLREIEEQITELVSMRDRVTNTITIDSQVEDLEEIIRLKTGTSNIELPLAVDSDGLSFPEETLKDIIIEPSLNPHVILFSKKNNETFESTKEVMYSIVGIVSEMAVIERRNYGEFNGNYKMGVEVSNDSKYLVSTTTPAEVNVLTDTQFTKK